MLFLTYGYKLHQASLTFDFILNIGRSVDCTRQFRFPGFLRSISPGSSVVIVVVVTWVNAEVNAGTLNPLLLAAFFFFFIVSFYFIC